MQQNLILSVLSLSLLGNLGSLTKGTASGQSDKVRVEVTRHNLLVKGADWKTCKLVGATADDSNRIIREYRCTAKRPVFIVEQLVKSESELVKLK